MSERKTLMWEKRREEAKAALAPFLEEMDGRSIVSFLDSIRYYGYRRPDGSWRSAKEWLR